MFTKQKGRNCDLHDRSNTPIGGGIVTRYGKKNTGGDMVHIDYGLTLFKKCYN
ncbi:MAG: hypothetical protein NTX46_03395 [Chloroflexi bacterium]|nr:hypothetical protein [Chloroflexota bacterium]